MSKERCSQRIFTGARWDMGGHPCSRPVKVHTADGKAWCAIHDPEAVARRNAKRDDKAREQRDALRAHRDETRRVIVELSRLLGRSGDIGEAFNPYSKIHDGYTGSLTISRAAAQQIIDRLTQGDRT